ncbi:MAG: hypothetical protein IJ299_03210 [Oscillospiraceae bacterium]|nr:hypothetical protein [Oscillospiraceae bacterium]
MKRICTLILICAFLLSGCGSETSSDMFSVPEMPEMQRALIETVESVLGGGFDYSEPRSGLNRQPLQLMDLDGDGEEEGIAFLRDIQETYKTFIYIFENGENGFTLFDIIEGSENELYTVSYSDILGEDGYEIIVEWGADGDGSHPITVYNLGENVTEKVLETSARQYSVSDIDGDGANDFLAVVKRGNALFADVYTAPDGAVKKKDSVPLSGGDRKILRIKTGMVSPGRNAVFIEREKDDGVVTDVVSYDGNNFVNLLPDGDVCVSRAVCADVTGDGVIEIPKETEKNVLRGITNRTYRWSAVSDNGTLIPSAFTYHAYSEGWYLLLPTAWSTSVYASRTVTRAGEVAVHFTTREILPGDTEDRIEAPLFSLYILTGGSRDAYAAEEGRFVIAEREDTLFAASIASESYLATQINEEFIKAAFKNIESEWFSEISFG